MLKINLKEAYETFGLTNEASELDIKSRYNDLLMACPAANKKAYKRIEQSYQVIMKSLSEKVEELPKFSLKKMAMGGKLTEKLKVSGMKKILAGVMIGAAVLSFGAWNNTPKTEEGCIGKGMFGRVSNSVLSNIDNTDNYYLVKLDGELHLTKRTVEHGDTTIYSYYDVKSRKLVGNTLNIPKSMKTKFGNDFSDELKDYNYSNGKYELGANIPYSAVTPLNYFVSSVRPSEKDLDFWMNNSDRANQEYEKIIMNNIVEQTTDEIVGSLIDYTNPLSSFECTKEDGEVETFVGYRASHSEKDIGYDYVYNIFDGSINYIGSNRNDAFVSVIENAVENGHSISELREMYSVKTADATSEKATEVDVEEFLKYFGQAKLGLKAGLIAQENEKQIEKEAKTSVSSKVEGSTSEVEASASPAVKESPAPKGNENSSSSEASPNEQTSSVEAKYSIQENEQVNVNKIRSFKDVKLLDLGAVKSKDEYKNLNTKGLNYILLVNCGSNEEKYLNPLVNNSFVTINENVYYNDENLDESIYVSKDYIVSMDKFLEKQGKSDMIKESYTLNDLENINSMFNISRSVSLEDYVVVENVDQVNEDFAKYTLLQKDTEFKDRYDDVIYFGNSGVYDNNLEYGSYYYNSNIDGELLTEITLYGSNNNDKKGIVNMYRLVDYLEKNGYSSLIKENATMNDIYNIYEVINGKELKIEEEVKTKTLKK